MTDTDADLPTLELLLIADVHYVHSADHHCPVPSRKSGWGLELVRRALRRAKREGVVDAVVLMGDLVDNGGAPGAEADLVALRDEIAELGVPVTVVPGNHDGDPTRVLRIFGDQPGLHRVKGYELLTFSDHYADDDRATRPQADLALLSQTEGPLLAFQHNPLHPPIDSTYPYNLTNAREVMRAYEQAGVVVSVSAHYHPGIEPEQVGGVTYMTCPALCEAPFQVIRLSLRGRTVTSRSVRLAMGEAPVPLIDFHAHSQYAYCADDVTAADVVEHAQAFGLSKVHITEHAGQLYLSAEDYWSGVFRRDASVIRRERDAGRGRMERFRSEMAPLRSASVGLGLEVETDADGKLTLLEEDAGGWDVIVGAVHVVPEIKADSPDPAQVVREFMADTERVVTSGVDIFAHPFRIFRRKDLRVPTELYELVAEMLAANGVAAEINFHTNEPDPAFFALCVEHGAKIALGSDSHGLWEVGEFAPHLEVLTKAVPVDRLPDVLYTGRANT